MLEKTINLADIIVDAYNFYKNPTDEEMKKDVDKSIGEIAIISYLPLKNKKQGVYRIISLLQENNRRPEEIAIQSELLFILEVFNQYTNVQVDDNLYEIFSEEFYDALQMTGVFGVIESISGQDIADFHAVLDSTLNWKNSFALINGFSAIDMSHVDELVKEVNDAKQYLKEDNLELLKRITDYNQPNVRNFSDIISASIVNSLDQIKEEEIEEWHAKNKMVINLDNILGEKTYENIVSEINKYFNEHQELGTLAESEIKNVYDYLKEKNSQEINKIDYAISEESKQNIVQGITSQMIKLLSKKKSLENKYKKEEELLRLADTIMSMNNNGIDEVTEVLKKYQNKEQENK